LQCIILAGGLGTRPGLRRAERPKVMIDIGGEPLIRHQLRLLHDGGVDDAVICIGYRGLLIEDEVARHCPPGMTVRCISDGQRLRGTAGAIRRAVEHGFTDERFMVLNGDRQLSVDCADVWHAFDSERYRGLMTVWRSGSLDSSNAGVGDGRVVVYSKGVDRVNHPCMNHAEYGLGIVCAQTLLDLTPAGVPYDLCDLYEAMAAQGQLQAYEVDEPFQEVGARRNDVRME
jgi:NDP-sugar pyrophosphorylase family protein